MKVQYTDTATEEIKNLHTQIIEAKAELHDAKNTLKEVSDILVVGKSQEGLNLIWAYLQQTPRKDDAHTFYSQQELDALMGEYRHALANLLKHVQTSYDPIYSLAVMIPPAQALRNQADLIEAKDKDIETARALLAKPSQSEKKVQTS